MNHELIVKATECKPCTVIGKNLKSVIPAKLVLPQIPCVEPNQEIQIDFRGPNCDEKCSEVYFLAAIDLFPKYSTAFIYEKANAPNILKFLDILIENYGILLSIRLDQEKCWVANQVETFCNKNNIEIIEAPVNGHRAIGLLERLNQTIKNRLACIKEEESANNALHVQNALRLLFINCEYVNRKQQKSR